MIDSQRAEQITDALLATIERERARVVIVDITGVGMVDTRVAQYLIQALKAANLLGWRRTYDEGTQNELEAGDVGQVLCRGGNPFVPATANAPAGAMIDHVSFGIAPWDLEAVRTALEARGLLARIDTSSAHVGADGKIIPDDVYQAAFQSYHTETPNGFNLQISWNTIDKRLALANAVKPQALRKYPVPLP